ncbi:carbohydrate ABC transporter permease [Paenibacillus eucommiae]|uniref:Multiple sugar transport system permease protein n=1 Tax=Paenibacillus eucommiae TaxID=1355755 RepID=A0ABS4IVY9_9BACL|nr:sugar ABC transporter permease [Paenibacillus eucommiae]MBP1991742.1 multiple sugar transport system permease protein [Paenibacillus eucommiae]
MQRQKGDLTHATPTKGMNGLHVKSYSRNRVEALEGFLFISPVVLGLLIFWAWPILQSFYYSFTTYSILKPAEWIGWANFKTLFNDPVFWNSLKITLIYTVLAVPCGLIVGFFLALLLKRQVPGGRWFRTLFYLPVVVPIVAQGVLWKHMYSPEVGLANQILKGIGLQPYPWFSDPDTVMTSLIIMSLWQAGGSMIIWIAGLEGVPEHLYEAAIVDGASPLRRFWSVTIPLVTPVIFFNLIIGMIGALQVFGQVLVTTGGGPLDSSKFLMVLIYEEAFGKLNMGYASAVSWVLFLIVLMFTLIIFRSSRLWVHYEGEQ